MTVYIYGLQCPTNGSIRYIGKSINPNQRLSAHISGAKQFAYDHHTARWIRKLLRSDLSPTLIVLDHVIGTEWRDRERQWILAGIHMGWPLTNSTAGGEGLDYLDPKDRAAWKANQNAAMKKYRDSEAGRDTFSRMVAAAHTPEANKKRAASVRISNRTPEYREKMKAINEEVSLRPEVIEKKSASMKLAWQDPEVGAKLLAAITTKEAKRKQSDAKIKSWADPIVGAKLRSIHSSEEVRAKKSAGAKARATPEYRAMMAEKTRLAWVKRKATKGA